jgi:hypothetical protein
MFSFSGLAYYDKERIFYKSELGLRQMSTNNGEWKKVFFSKHLENTVLTRPKKTPLGSGAGRGRDQD